MDYTIYYDGMPVNHVTARTIESAQQHADETSSHPVVAVHVGSSAEAIAAAKFKSRLLAAKVTDRIDMIASKAACEILAGLGGGFSDGTRDMVEKDIRAALHLFRQSSNSGMAAALREIAKRDDCMCNGIAASALLVGGVQ